MTDGSSRDDVETRLRAEIGHAPCSADAHLSLGTYLAKSGRLEEALPVLERCLVLDPRNPKAHLFTGNVFRFRGSFEEAVLHYRAALDADPDYLLAWTNSLRTLMDAHDWDCVEAGLERICHVEPAAPLVSREVRSGWEAYITPMDSLLLPLDFESRLAVARFHADRIARGATPVDRSASAPGSKIRVGYLSRDFRDHAVGHLAQALWEWHDRDRFEIRAYSTGRDDGSPYRCKAEMAADCFTDCRSMSDEVLANRIARDRVDVLVDLGGFTTEHRLGVLARRPAPVQWHYLGYPGTLGATFMDGFVSDWIVSPAGQETQFEEPLIRLPGCFMVSDPDLLRPRPVPDRQRWGLPPEGTVLCAFHQTAKVRPAVRDAWLAILAAVPNSVLWLKTMPEEARRRFRSAAVRHGVDPLRLIFAPNIVGRFNHLSRLACADLFLDTFHGYGGHSSANEALWLGIPVLTVAGATFASRVSNSLLNAAGLPELIAEDVSVYLELAVRLAKDSTWRNAIRGKLANQYESASGLRIAQAPVRALEQAYELAMKRQRVMAERGLHREERSCAGGIVNATGWL
jgi:predicted O-linked N-acetylglucosamine transferase (SPINDLY family)